MLASAYHRQPIKPIMCFLPELLRPSFCSLSVYIKGCRSLLKWSWGDFIFPSQPSKMCEYIDICILRLRVNVIEETQRLRSRKRNKAWDRHVSRTSRDSLVRASFSPLRFDTYILVSSLTCRMRLLHHRGGRLQRPWKPPLPPTNPLFKPVAFLCGLSHERPPSRVARIDSDKHTGGVGTQSPLALPLLRSLC
jgi:hypothetical protein